MARAHQVAIGADGRAFNSAIKNDVVKPLEDAARTLDELADAGADAGQDAARGIGRLEDALKDATRETERLERSSRDVGDVGGHSMDRIRDGASEVQNEIGQNLGAAVSTIRGDFSDLGQVGQDTLGGLAATAAAMGPAGLAGALALAAGAVGLGAITAGLEDAEARQQRLIEQGAEWGKAFMESGGNILTASQIVAAGQEIFGDPERYKEAQQNAKDWGVEISTAVAAMAGSQSAIDAVTGSVDAQRAALEANARGADGLAQNIESATTGQNAANDAYLRGKSSLDDLNGALNIGRETAGYMSEMLLDLVKSADYASEQTDDLGNKVITLPDQKQIFIDAETGEASTNVDNFRGNLETTASKVYESTVKVKLDSSEYDNWHPPLKTATVNTHSRWLLQDLG